MHPDDRIPQNKVESKSVKCMSLDHGLSTFHVEQDCQHSWPKEENKKYFLLFFKLSIIN